MITLDKLRSIALTRLHETCIVYKNESYSWDEIIRRTESRIIFLRRIYNDDQLRSVSYLSKNNVDLICWLAAFSTLGIPTNGLDYSLSVETLTTLISRINPGILLVSFDLYKADELNRLNVSGATMLAIDAPTDPIIGSIGELHHTRLATLITYHQPVPFRSVSLTSGTSSVPKIALRYRSFDARRFTWFSERYNFSQDDGFMLILPLYHAAGNGWARMFMGLGAPLYLVDQEDDQMMMQTLSSSKVKATVMTPNLVSRLTTFAEQNRINHHLRWVLVGGSYFPVKNKRAAISSLGAIIYEYYGCTESGVNVLSEPADMLACPESVGKAFEGNIVKILNEKNELVSIGEKGRVAISSYMLMDEYGDGRKPFIIIDGNRYFLMADYGYLDNQNRLFLINRDGETHNRNAIYHIEENIRKMPCIKDVALISVLENGVHNIKCVFSMRQKDKEKQKILIERIKEKIIPENIINFTACAVDVVPYSPSGKVRFSEIIRILDAA
ncbi:AMP-binding protein [Budvicia diplopodorum]|uniref:AMP-binding protein n=1 Tax=Budvicia diplopodorum TaxID=1119056 RepID=UPI00135979D2|nr:AMP-binding protein [Budvicia diplopodorum]